MFRFLLKLAGLALAVAAGWALLVSYAPSGWIVAGTPCPRNLGWVDSWTSRASPLESVSFDLPEGGRGRLCYGRPSLRGRTMIGGDAVPYERLWRLGANEPTTLHLTRVAYVGDMVLAPGSYSLYAIPGLREWEIVVNRNTHQWGLESEYTDEVAAGELGRIKVRASKLDHSVEKLTFTTRPAATGAVELVFEWQNVTWRLALDSREPENDPIDETPAPSPDL